MNMFKKYENKPEDSKSLEDENFNPEVLRMIATAAAREERAAKEAYKQLIRNEKLQDLANLMKKRAQAGYIVADFSIFDTHCPNCLWITDNELKELFPSFTIVPSDDHPGTERRIFWK